VTERMFPDGAAFVAGGSGGIGSVICQALAEAGADVVLTYRNNEAAANEAAAAVRTAGQAAEVVRLDLQDTAATVAAVNAAVARFGAIHTAVYTAGPVVHHHHISSVAPEDFKAVLLGDTFACFNLVHASLPHLRESRGSIVTVTTTMLFRWPPKGVLSAVPKAAINRLMSGIAREEGRFGVRANSVALGMIDAGMLHKTDEFDEKQKAAMAVNVPLRRLGQAREVADAVVFLASSKAGYSTGQVLAVDGGYPT